MIMVSICCERQNLTDNNWGNCSDCAAVFGVGRSGYNDICSEVYV